MVKLTAIMIELKGHLEENLGGKILSQTILTKILIHAYDSTLWSQNKPSFRDAKLSNFNKNMQSLKEKHYYS